MGRRQPRLDTGLCILEAVLPLAHATYQARLSSNDSGRVSEAPWGHQSPGARPVTGGSWLRAFAPSSKSNTRR
jgi:hypothetical protein